MGNGQSWQATRIFERRSPFRSDGNVAALSFYGATFTSPDGNIRAGESTPLRWSSSRAFAT
jgi:hypothetical protein